MSILGARPGSQFLPGLDRMDALVLAGGASRRMGQNKATLPWGGSSVIEAVLDALRPMFRRTLIVARDVEGLAGLDAEVVPDGRDQQGPLAGLAWGLASSDAEWCFLAGCDMPFLQPHVIRGMALELDESDVLAVKCGGRVQPLHAFYNRRCVGTAEELLAEGDTSLRGLLARSRVKCLGEDWLADVDPARSSFRDLDTWADYQEALKNLGQRKSPASEAGPRTTKTIT